MVFKGSWCRDIFAIAKMLMSSNGVGTYAKYREAVQEAVFRGYRIEDAEHIGALATDLWRLFA